MLPLPRFAQITPVVIKDVCSFMTDPHSGIEFCKCPRIMKDYPDLWAARERDKLNFRYPNGESYQARGVCLFFLVS